MRALTTDQRGKHMWPAPRRPESHCPMTGWQSGHGWKMAPTICRLFLKYFLFTLGDPLLFGLSICYYVRLSVSLFVSLSIFLFVYLFVCMTFNLPVYLFVCRLYVCNMYVCLYAVQPVCLSVFYKVRVYYIKISWFSDWCLFDR